MSLETPLLIFGSVKSGALFSRTIVVVVGTFLLEVRGCFFVTAFEDFVVLPEEGTRLSIKF